ncbi:MAG: DUF2914 domain-containing protein [Luteitalea sp.]|nr:DUF2914 domain-containing protein [Luteitalea sp.]
MELVFETIAVTALCSTMREVANPNRRTVGNAMSELWRARHMLDAAAQAAAAGDLVSADKLLRDAARIQEAELGRLHPDLANTLNNLAIVAEHLGRADAAETFYRRSAAIASAASARVTTQAAPPPRRASRLLGWGGLSVGALVTAVLLAWHPWSLRNRSTPVLTTESTSARATEPGLRLLTEPAPVERAEAPTLISRRDDEAPGTAPLSGAVTLTTARLCQRLSTGGASWRCHPARDAVERGPLVLYTRVRCARDTVVVHRWYREDTLRLSVKLTIRANAAEGYRTYSRPTLHREGQWRVEVRTVDGNLLHEQRFAVQ